MHKTSHLVWCLPDHRRHKNDLRSGSKALVLLLVSLHDSYYSRYLLHQELKILKGDNWNGLSCHFYRWPSLYRDRGWWSLSLQVGSCLDALLVCTTFAGNPWKDRYGLRCCINNCLYYYYLAEVWLVNDNASLACVS